MKSYLDCGLYTVKLWFENIGLFNHHVSITITIITCHHHHTFDEGLLSTSLLLFLSRGSGFDGFALTGGFGSQAARRSRTWMCYTWWFFRDLCIFVLWVQWVWEFSSLANSCHPPCLSGQGEPGEGAPPPPPHHLASPWKRWAGRCSSKSSSASPRSKKATSGPPALELVELSLEAPALFSH